ncbi:MAG: glycosyltransferase [Bacilli bacterium]
MNKKITIGLFNDSFFPMSDGVTMVVDNYAKRLRKYANVVVFVPDYSNKKFDDENLSYKVVRCKSIKVPFLDYSLALPKFDKNFSNILDKYNIDLIHIHSPFSIGNAGLKYALKHNVPCIATMHSQFKLDFLRAVKSEKIATILTYNLIKLFNKCDECWAVNNEVARIYYKDYHYKTMPKVMNNATEMLPVKDKKNAEDYINKKYNIKPNEKVFLFVGRINKLKNIFFIVDSLKILKENYPGLKFKMLFVGCGQDEKELKEYINKNNLQESVIMCGKVTDRKILAYYYHRADLFLFPSVYDASSIVQIEAASQKTPTIFIENTATSTTVTNNINGFISAPTKEDFSSKIYEVINDKKLYNKVKENAYKDLYKTWDNVIEEVYNSYKQIIKNQKK